MTTIEVPYQQPPKNAWAGSEATVGGGVAAMAGASGGSRQFRRGVEVEIFKQPAVARCYMTLFDDKQNKLYFQTNPMVYEFEKSAEYKHDVIPGLSGPYSNFVAGGQKTINIVSTWIDRCPTKEPDNPKSANVIENAIKWIEAKLHNNQKEGVLASAPPSIILFIGGKTERVRIEKMKVSITKRYPNQRPREATITIDCFQVVSKHTNPKDVLKKYFW